MTTKRNTTWTVTAVSPLLRPGLSINIRVSEKYLIEETLKLMEKVRELNIVMQEKDLQTKASIENK